MAVVTNPHLSKVHAANFRREIQSAASAAELKAAAKKHGDYLLGRDKDILRQEYTERLGAVKGHKS